MNNFGKRILIILCLLGMAASVFFSIFILFFSFPVIFKIIAFISFTGVSYIFYILAIKVKKGLIYIEKIKDSIDEDVEKFEKKLETQLTHRCPKCCNKFDGEICLICGYGIEERIAQEGDN